MPIVLLLILYPTLRYIYYKPEEIRPCSGVCNLTDVDIASAPEGCKPSNPNRLFYIQIPRTASKSMHKAMLARRLDKGWTSVSVKDWRDASMWLPVFANKMHVGLFTTAQRNNFTCPASSSASMRSRSIDVLSNTLTSCSTCRRHSSSSSNGVES